MTSCILIVRRVFCRDFNAWNTGQIVIINFVRFWSLSFIFKSQASHHHSSRHYQSISLVLVILFFHNCAITLHLWSRHRSWPRHQAFVLLTGICWFDFWPRRHDVWNEWFAPFSCRPLFPHRVCDYWWCGLLVISAEVIHVRGCGQKMIWSNSVLIENCPIRLYIHTRSTFHKWNYANTMWSVWTVHRTIRGAVPVQNLELNTAPVWSDRLEIILFVVVQTSTFSSNHLRRRRWNRRTGWHQSEFCMDYKSFS